MQPRFEAVAETALVAGIGTATLMMVDDGLGAATAGAGVTTAIAVEQAMQLAEQLVAATVVTHVATAAAWSSCRSGNGCWSCRLGWRWGGLAHEPSGSYQQESSIHD